MATVQEISVIEAIGLNVERNDTDMRVRFAYDIDGRLTPGDHAFGRIFRPTPTPRGLVETDDELSYFHDAAPLEPLRKDLVGELRDALLSQEPYKVPDGYCGKMTILNGLTMEAPDTGLISVRLGLILYINGVERVRKWHRYAIDPRLSVPDRFTPIDYMLHEVNDDITRRPELMAAPIAEERLDTLQSVCSIMARHSQKQQIKGPLPRVI